MKNKISHTLDQQLNAWVVTQFIEEVYNKKSMNQFSEYLAHSCQFCQENMVIGESPIEIQLHFAYTWINQQALFQTVEYRIEEILTQNDIVSVKIRRCSELKPDVSVDPELCRWEMYQLRDGKIVQRWTARA